MPYYKVPHIRQVRSHNGIIKRKALEYYNLDQIFSKDILWTMPSDALQAFNILSQTNKDIKYKKTNHFPKFKHIVSKNISGKLLMEAKNIYGDELFSFVINQWALPSQIIEFKRQFKFIDNDIVYILKPSNGMQGTDIKLLTNYQEIENMIYIYENKVKKFIAQEYIDNPLLINGYKFDFRIYCLITDITKDNMCIYVFKEGLIRLSTIKYKNHVKKILIILICI